MRALLLFVFLSACATSQPEKWELPTSEKVICQSYEQTSCGLALKDCGDSRSVQFECLNQAIYWGPGEYFEPEIIDETKKEEAQ